VESAIFQAFIGFPELVLLLLLPLHSSLMSWAGCCNHKPLLLNTAYINFYQLAVNLGGGKFAWPVKTYQLLRGTNFQISLPLYVTLPPE
jgi:hypothetical protein